MDLIVYDTDFKLLSKQRKKTWKNHADLWLTISFIQKYLFTIMVYVSSFKNVKNVFHVSFSWKHWHISQTK